jgi:DNA polymerase III epsilon subunit family exonuclease
VKVIATIILVLIILAKVFGGKNNNKGTPTSPPKRSTPLTQSRPSRHNSALPTVEYTPMYTAERPKSKKRLQELKQGGYIIFDTETTGLSARNDKIIELALLRCDKDGNITRYSSLFNPGRPLDGRIQSITGLTDADLASAPRIEEHLPYILSFIGDLPLVAHNASFDGNFLSAELTAAGMRGNFVMIDTLWMSRRAFPGLPNYKLATLIDRFGLSDGPQSHRAPGDVECTKKLFDLCVDELLRQREAELAARRAAKANAAQ